MAPAPLKAGEGAQLSSYLAQHGIVYFDAKAGKDQVVETLIRRLNLPNPDEALRLLKEREEAGGVLIKPNVAIPHTSINGIRGVRAALGIQKNGGDRFFWLLFVSGADSIRDHLEFLKSAAQTLTDEVLEELAKTEDPEKAMRVLSRIPA